MRLINADDVMEMLTNIELSCTPIPTIEAKTGLRDIPTAYDVDKVVERLEEKAKAYDDPASSDEGFRRYCRGIATGYRYAVDIVKAGGEDE